MTRKANPPWTAQEQQELEQLFESYLLALRRWRGRQTYDPQFYTEFWASEQRLISHRGFALLTQPILERMGKESKPKAYDRDYDLDRLLSYALAEAHPEQGRQITAWEIQRFETVMQASQHPLHLHAIAQRLQSSKSKVSKEFFYRVWVDAWNLYKALPPKEPQYPQDLQSPNPLAVLSTFLTAFREPLLFEETHRYLCEILDAFVPSDTQPAAFKGSFSYAQSVLFDAALSALKRLKTPEALEKIQSLAELLQSPRRTVRSYDTVLLLAVRKAYAELFPLERLVWLFASLQKEVNAPAQRLVHEASEGAILVHWSRVFTTLSRRLKREPLTYPQHQRLFQALSDMIRRMAWPAGALCWSSFVVTQATLARFIRAAARLGFVLPSQLPEHRIHPYLQLACFQIKCAQHTETSEEEARPLLESQELSLRNGALYAMAEHTDPSVVRQFLRSLFVVAHHQQSPRLVRHVQDMVQRETALQTQAPLATDWLKVTCEEDALLSALLFFASAPPSPLARTCAFRPMAWIRRMGGQSWHTIQRLLTMRLLPTAQAEQVWLACLRDEGIAQRQAAWLFWPLAVEADLSCTHGPQRGPSVASALIEDLLRPSESTEIHRLKSSWLLRFGEPLLVEALHQHATPEALALLDKATKGRIQRLLLRLDPRTLKAYHIDLEASLFS